MIWAEAFAARPLVAVLRGLSPAEVPAIADALCDEGLLLAEVTLNSPEPLSSITLLRQRLGDRMLIGAGTVLSAQAVGDARDAGAQFIVSPNTDPEVIAAAKAAGLACLPGFFTPSEAFVALSAGADAIKLFPVEAAQPSVLKALLAVLPPGAAVLPVGGIAEKSMAPWRAAGAAGFGFGSSLYRAGRPAAEVRVRARALVRAWDECGPAASGR